MGKSVFPQKPQEGWGRQEESSGCVVLGSRQTCGGKQQRFPAGAVPRFLWKAALPAQSCTDAERGQRRPSARLASPGREGPFRGRCFGFSVFSPGRPRCRAQRGRWRLLPPEQLLPREKQSCGFAAVRRRGREEPFPSGQSSRTGGARPGGHTALRCCRGWCGLCRSRLFCVSTTALSVVVTLSCE